MARRFFGDSITEGAWVPDVPRQYASILRDAIWPDAVTYAERGAAAFDQAPVIYEQTIQTGDAATLMVGINDTWFHNEGGQPSFTRAMGALLAWLSIPETHRLRADDPAVSYSGEWQKTQAYGLGMNATARGASASFQMAGDVIYLGMIQQDRAQEGSINGSADIFVDGRNIATIETQSGIEKSPKGRGYGPALVRLHGLGPGMHDVRIEVTSDGPRGLVYFDWAAPATNGATVYVAPPTRMKPAGYAQYNVPVAVAMSYQEAVRDVADTLAGDGLGVHLVETVDLLTEMDFPFEDGVHPNAYGHRKLARAFLDRITETSDP